MRAFRKKNMFTLLGSLLSIVVAGNAIFSTGAVAAPSTAQSAEHSSAAVAISPGEVNHLLAAARQLADARLRAEGMSPDKHPPRIGWFIPVECYCLQANEKTFQDALQITVFNVAAPLDHMDVRVQRNTMMRLNKKVTPRIPDIYYFRLNKAHPTRGLGYINELKVGDQAMGRRNSEASYDHNLYIQGYGIGANTFDKGEYLPVTAAFWWFAPDVEGVTYYNSAFLIHLLSLGINIVYMVQNDNAQPWPRRESKKQEAKDVEEIESNDESTALSGLDNLIGPCVMAPTCPSP
ncbi:MAG: hypothetical protein ABSA02_18450 [Trebonia sp.]